MQQIRISEQNHSFTYFSSSFQEICIATKDAKFKKYQTRHDTLELSTPIYLSSIKETITSKKSEQCWLTTWSSWLPEENSICTKFHPESWQYYVMHCKQKMHHCLGKLLWKSYKRNTTTSQARFNAYNYKLQIESIECVK